MKTNILAIIFLLLTSVGFSQEKKNLIELGIGTGYPVGVFSNTEGDDAGYSDMSFNLKLNYDHLFNEKFGIFIQLSSQANIFQSEEYAKDLEKAVGDVDITFDYAFHTISYSSVGLLYSIQLNDDVFIQPRLGICNYSYTFPTLDGIMMYNNTSEDFSFSATGTNKTIGLLPGFAIRQYFKNVTIAFSVEYLHFNVNDIELELTAGDVTETETGGELKVRSLNTSASIGFMF